MKAKRTLLVLACAFPLLIASPAWAHYLTVTGAFACDDTGKLVMNYTVSSWTQGVAGENPNVQISVNGVVVATGAFESPAYSFSGSIPVPTNLGAGDPITFSAVAVANWGDGYPGGQSAGGTGTVPDQSCVQPGYGRFTGGGQQVRIGPARFNKGLTIHCDLLLSNNLEVNWAGNSFHMTEHLFTVSCTDDPNIIQAPPAAPLDTLVGVGRGRYNGVDGYTIEFTLVDAGEPGTYDKAAIRIYPATDAAPQVPTGPDVLKVPLGFVDSGNLQAHYDQPHK